MPRLHGISLRFFRRFATASVILGLVTLGPSNRTAEAIVPPPGLAAAVIQALPTIATVVKTMLGVKPGKEQDAAIKGLTDTSDKGKANLAQYAQREQIVWRIVSAGSLSATHLAGMVGTSANQATLSPDQTRALDKDWKFVTSGFTAIVDAKPDPKYFTSDTEEMRSINDLLLQGKAFNEDITTLLKSYEDKPDPGKLRALQTDLQEFQALFNGVLGATATELELIGDEIAALSITPTAPTDSTKPTKKKTAKQAGEDAAKQAFGDPKGLAQLNDVIAESKSQLDIAIQKPLKPADII